jgi:isovaleryl-CoA dehydrogenase
MQACMDITLPYVHTRKQFDTPIGHFQLMQGKLADMHVKLSAARAYTMAAARAADEGAFDTRDCAGAIMYASNMAVECANDAMQALGGNGFINEYPAGRLLRDSRVRFFFLWCLWALLRASTGGGEEGDWMMGYDQN